MNWKVVCKSLLTVPLFAALVSCAPQTRWGDKIIVCGDCELYVVDVSRSTEDSLAVDWHWSIYDEGAGMPVGYEEKTWSIDDCKPVCGGTKILATSGGGSTLLIDMADKHVEFYAHTPMAHSAEMLPGNRIAVASSTHAGGNSLELYEVGRNEEVIWKDSLYFGHGVVWSEKYKSLYALGFDELRRYSLRDWDSVNPGLNLEETFSLPYPYGHELSPAGRDRLVVSSHGHVSIFNMKDGSFEPFEPLKDVKDVKSANWNPDTGRLVYTKAENSWWTDHVYLENPDKTLTFREGFHLYKCRVL